MMRGDFGTENVLIKDMQNWFKRHSDHDTSYLEVASTQNQRIEGWWSDLRRQHIQHWMDIFKNLQENGEFSASDIDKNILRFCFMALIQTEMDLAVSMWNGHSIRQSRNSNAPKGQPNRMFNYPELWGSRNFICDVHQDDINVARTQVTFRTPVCCDPDLYDILIGVMADDSLSYPNTSDEALALYRHLRRRVLRMFNMQ
ncbi:hypothetical protein DPMN_119306 [Dreissena polymorpha]|uniref:Integrase core domain-containing protein n=1 Tax=Dreissena polymorpha TaxID=45954 RepID=A0A9D4GLS6_DREPO|nr:hypothetical protein DPMN_119306 [Dreissena polymorpha]